MRRVFYLWIVAVLCCATSLQATTYLKMWVNGVVSDTLTQGDFYAWEFDVSQTGGTAFYSIYLDADNSQSVSEGDVWFDTFEMTDGQPGNEGPGDSSDVADGIVYANLGPFGFAPGAYIMKAEDSDGSSAEAPLFIKALAAPAATISGTLSIEGVTAPDAGYENIMIGAQAKENFAGYWSGLTDQYGNYSINLPPAAIGALWNADVFFDGQLDGYSVSDDVDIIVQAGANEGVNFEALAANAFVYGALMDEHGDSVKVDAYGQVANNYSKGFDFEFYGGRYSVPVVAESGGEWFHFNLHEVGIQPDYMVPDGGESFYLSPGDTLNQNITLYETNSTIHVVITMEGGQPGQSFYMRAYSDTFGYAYAVSGPDGSAQISVRDDSDYHVYVSQDDDYYADPFPEGYVFEKASWQFSQPGDTVYFNLVPASGFVYGSVAFADGASSHAFNHHDMEVVVFDSTHEKVFYGGLSEYADFGVYVQDGEYSMELNNWSDQFLSLPARFDGVNVASDSVGPFEFTVNHAHAVLEVRLLNFPDEVFHDHMYIQTNGTFPNVYQADTYSEEDSTFRFNVCDGQWRVAAPDGHVDTLVTVSEQDSNVYVELDYNKVTNIGHRNHLPLAFEAEPAYPNPFNPATTLAYTLPREQRVTLQVFDNSGRLVQTLYQGRQPAGRHSHVWTATHLASGVYFFRMETPEKAVVQKLLLIK